jgi:hypothetical protein
MAVFRIRIHRIRKFLGLPDPVLFVRCTDPDPSNITQNSKKTLISLFCDFFMTLYLCKMM